MADRLQSALILGVSPNPLKVLVISEEAQKLKKGRYRIRLVARIPLGRLLLVPQADEHLGRVTVWVAVSNQYGDTSDVHSRRLPVRVPWRDLRRAMTQDIGYTVDLTIRGGQQRVAVIVRDEISQVSSTVTFDLEDGRLVGAAPVRRAALEEGVRSGL
jgi:hypothetical protein